jgi:hypothetical protein
LGPTLACGESEIPIFKLWKKKLFLANLDFFPLPPNAQTTSTSRRGIAPVIAMSRLGRSSRPLRDPASRHRISDPHFFHFYWSSHCTSNGFFGGAEEKGGEQRFLFFVDDCHLGYVTKIENKKPLHTSKSYKGTIFFGDYILSIFVDIGFNLVN